MLFENAELVRFLMVSMTWIQWIFLWLAGWTTKKQTANWRNEKINIGNGEEGNCASVMLVCVVGNRRRCGLNIREKTESEKGLGKKMAGGSEFCWKSSDVSASQAPRRKVYLWKKLNFPFWHGVWIYDVYTHMDLCLALCFAVWVLVYT